MINSIIWFIGALLTCIVVLGTIQLLYMLLTDVFNNLDFDADKLKEDITNYLSCKIIYEDNGILEDVCDDMLIKFPEIDNIEYKADSESNVVEFTIITKNLKTFNVSISPKSAEGAENQR